LESTESPDIDDGFDVSGVELDVVSDEESSDWVDW
jgi:hypothetical protein